MYAFSNLSTFVFCSWNLKTENAAATTVCERGGRTFNGTFLFNRNHNYLSLVEKSCNATD